MLRGTSTFTFCFAPTLAGALLLASCKKDRPDDSAPATTPVAAAPAPSAPTAPTVSSSDPDCIGAWTLEGPRTTMVVGERKLEIQGARLAETTSDADDEAAIGIVANIKEDTAENMKNLQAIIEFFKAEGVETIVVDGDLGETQSQIEHVLEPLAAVGVPTLALMGNREGKADFNKAIANVQSKHDNLVNLNFVRLAVLDDVALVSMPGYYDKTYIHAEDGCHYKPSDVAALKPIVASVSDRPVVLVSHGPPRQDGPEAIDRMSEQANVGDPELAKLVREADIKFGVFANIQEAGGRATNRDGTSLVGEGRPASELFLNPGPADAVAWKMNDRTESVGMAAVLRVKGKQASFKVYRVSLATR